MAPGPDEEVPLTGGNMTAVVRVGDTVRRAAGPWTPTVHALLRHVRADGFDLAPEPLGMDEQGREILTFIPGRPGGVYPMPEFMYGEATRAAVTRALRAFHDATATFVAPSGAMWQFPAHAPAEVICHNDFAPYNLVFDGERLAGVIDFDLASPGPRVWDLAYAAYRFVPLGSPENPDLPHPGPAEQARRLQRLCATYGADAIRPRDILDTAITRLRDLNAFMHREAAAGNAAQQAIIDRGRGRIYDRDAAYLERERDRIASA